MFSISSKLEKNIYVFCSCTSYLKYYSIISGILALVCVFFFFFFEKIESLRFVSCKIGYFQNSFNLLQL